MALSDAERQRRYRDRKRGGPPVPRAVQPHGTPAAYKRHLRAMETPCDACKRAESDRQAELYRRRRERIEIERWLS